MGSCSMLEILHGGSGCPLNSNGNGQGFKDGSPNPCLPPGRVPKEHGTSWNLGAPERPDGGFSSQLAWKTETRGPQGWIKCAAGTWPDLRADGRTQARGEVERQSSSRHWWPVLPKHRSDHHNPKPIFTRCQQAPRESKGIY